VARNLLTSFSNQLSDKALFAIIAVCGLLIRMIFAWTGWAEGSLIADDAYYYFGIASNLAAGNGSTFDGLALTNGYHPLWMIVLVPIFAIFSDSLWIPVRIAVSTCALFDLFTGILIYNLLKHCGLKKGALLASLFWFLMPFTTLLGLRAMEASLSVLIIMLLTTVMMSTVAKGKQIGMKDAVLVGGIIGLAGLARTDNLPTLALITALFSCLVFRRQLGSWAKSLVWLSVSGITASLVMVPWFIWNYTRFESIVQVSGLTKLYSKGVYGALLTDWGSFSGIVKSLSYPILAPVIFPCRYLCGEEFSQPMVSFPVVLCLLAITFSPLLVTFRQVRKEAGKSVLEHLLLFAICYMAAHTLLFGFIWRSYATWYALPYFAFLAIVSGVALPAFWNRIRSKPIIRGSFLTLLVALPILTYTLFITRLPQQPRRPEIGWSELLETISGRYDDGVVVGAFNAGAIGYVAREHPQLVVVNLDCLVNNEAFEHVKRGRYLEYLLRTVDVFVEDPGNARMFLEPSEVDSLCFLYQKWKGYRAWSKGTNLTGDY